MTGTTGLGEAMGAGRKVEGALLRLDEMGGLDRDWDDLAARALEPNVFLGRWMAGARLRHLPDRDGARVLVAWRRDGEDRRLVGLLVLVLPRGRHANPWPVLRAAELYAPLSTPLLDPGDPARTWSAMLATLAEAGIVALALPYLAADGPAAAALREAAATEGASIAILDAHRRAFLRSPLGGAAYIRATLQRRRRREANRQRNRLSEMGPLVFTVARSEAEVAAALDGFLALEASGWKGRARTDLRAAPGGAAFVREIAAEGARGGVLRIATLSLAGRPVAGGLVATSQRRAFYVKTAYDEALARFSPGLLLTLDLTEALLDDPGIADADSIAVADHPMIDRIWTERLSIESVVVSTGHARGRFAAALAAERGRQALFRIAKVAVARLRRRKAVD